MLCGTDLAAEAEGFCFEFDLTGSFSWRNPTDYHKQEINQKKIFVLHFLYQIFDMKLVSLKIDFERLIVCCILLEPRDVEVGYKALPLLISLKHW